MCECCAPADPPLPIRQLDPNLGDAVPNRGRVDGLACAAKNESANSTPIRAKFLRVALGDALTMASALPNIWPRAIDLFTTGRTLYWDNRFLYYRTDSVLGQPTSLLQDCFCTGTIDFFTTGLTHCERMQPEGLEKRTREQKSFFNHRDRGRVYNY